MAGNDITNYNVLDNISKDIITTANDHGINTNLLLTKLLEELNANETKIFNYKGDIIYSKELPNYDIRQRARMDAHKLLDHYPADKHAFAGTVTATRSPEELTLLHTILDKVIQDIRLSNNINIIDTIITKDND